MNRKSLLVGGLLLVCASPTRAATLHVWTNSPAPAVPFTNWATAAHTIQEAVDEAQVGDTVLVTNGVYNQGGAVGILSTLLNRVCVPNAIALRSVNGPQATTIQGVGPCGDNAVRCANLGDGALLIGFTLANGNTRTNHDLFFDKSGGGILASDSAVISNCVVTGCGSFDSMFGGGVYGGVLYNCTLSQNQAYGSPGSGGGAGFSALYDCNVISNTANSQGGGTYGCQLYRCTLFGNRSIGDTGTGGGADQSTLYACTVMSNSAERGGGVYGCDAFDSTLSGNRGLGGDSGGGGAAGSQLRNCTISGNQASSDGGGVQNSSLTNCLLYGNSVTGKYSYGGAASFSDLHSCTVVGNEAVDSCGGVSRGDKQVNCIVYSNMAPNNANYEDTFFEYSCSMPLPAGTGNKAALPVFVAAGTGYGSRHIAGNYRLQAASPCVNTGTNLAWMAMATDPDGKPRVIGGRVDMGAYEYGTPTDFQRWLQAYGLATDGSADGADGDEDRFTNWQEWRTGTIPTNGLSYFCFDQSCIASEEGYVIWWPSITGRTYRVDGSTNLLANPAFQKLAGSITGQVDYTEYIDTGSTGRTVRFYRVGVE